MMPNACHLCGHGSLHEAKAINRFMQLPMDTCAYECRECGLIQRFALPTMGAEPTDLIDGEYTAGGKTANRRMVERLAMLERHIQGRRLLDVGTGTGSFVDSARSRGWEAIGIEPLQSEPVDGTRDEDALPRIVYCDLGNRGASGRGARIFRCHLNHVLEHVLDPVAFLSSCRRFLKPDGCFIIEVPNEIASGSTWVKMKSGKSYKSKTAFYEHRFFFTPKSFGAALEATGWQIESLKTSFICHGRGIIHRLWDYFQSRLGRGLGHQVENAWDTTHMRPNAPAPGHRHQRRDASCRHAAKCCRAPRGSAGPSPVPEPWSASARYCFRRVDHTGTRMRHC